MSHPNLMERHFDFVYLNDNLIFERHRYWNQTILIEKHYFLRSILFWVKDVNDGNCRRTIIAYAKPGCQRNTQPQRNRLRRCRLFLGFDCEDGKR